MPPRERGRVFRFLSRPGNTREEPHTVGAGETAAGFFEMLGFGKRKRQ